MNPVRRINGDRGSALVMVLIFTAALLMIGSFFLRLSLTEARISSNHRDEVALWYLAEAGAEVGVGVLSKDFNHETPVEGEIGGGGYQVNFVIPPDPDYPFLLEDQRLVISRGNLYDREFTLQVLVWINPGNGMLITEVLTP